MQSLRDVAYTVSETEVFKRPHNQMNADHYTGSHDFFMRVQNTKTVQIGITSEFHRS